MGTMLTRQQLYDLFVTELQAQQSRLTDTSEGSLIDVLAGITSQVLSEMSELTVAEFAKTFFDSADGPEVTGSSDDLQTLAVDHFGDSFARPAATKAAGTVTFSRVSAAAGDCTIPAGTTLATAANANGEKTRFVTTAEVTMTATSIDAIVECTTAGVGGNVAADKVITVESTLTDASITVNNDEVMSGGDDEQNDAQYRETIRNQLKSLKGATLSALQATALTVAGVETATAIEELMTAIQYNIGTGLPVPGAAYFQFPFARIYIADVNGTASDTLVEDVQAAIDAVRAAGVKVTVIGADAVTQNWTASVTLNAGGPNFAELSSSKTKLLATMSQYIAGLAIGTGFNRTAAQNAVLAIWGPAGTNDLTAFTISAPIGDVAITATQKLVAGTMSIV